MNFLIKANEMLPEDKQFSIYIANVKLVIETASSREDIYYDSFDEDNESSDDSDWYMVQSSKYIDNWYGINGISCSKNSVTDFKFFNKIINPNVKNSFLTDMQEISLWGSTKKIQQEGPCGYNEDATRTTTYNKHLVAFWPKKKDFHMFFEMNHACTINWLHDNLDDNSNTNEKFIENLTNVVNKLIQSEKSTISDYSLEKLSRVFQKVKNEKLLNQILQHFLFPTIALANIITSYNWETLENSLTIKLKPDLINISKYCDLIKVNLNYIFIVEKEK